MTPGAAGRRAVTVSQLRAHRAAAKAMRGRRPALRKKITPQVPPKAIARSYLAALLVVVRDARAAVKREIEDRYTQLAKKAAAGQSVHDEIAAAVDRAQASWAREWPAAKLRRLVSEYATRTSTFQRAELVRQLKGPLGVEVKIADTKLAPRLHAFTAEGVAGIQALIARYFAQVRAVAMKLLRPSHGDSARTDAPPPPPDGGMGPPEDRGGPDTFELEGQVGLDRFTLDLGKRGDAAEGYSVQLSDLSIRGLFGDLNEARQKELGLDEYTWETMEDDLVRPEHAKLHGKRCRWDDPPAIGNPGDPPGCRCQATPVVAEVQDLLQ